ncbi:MAG: AAA family ATPase, partial [Arcobacteraceae bacterium]|nr:AAA family ATPase [Arcobacteraceae bacterium]
MQEIIHFIKTNDIEQTEIYKQLKCSKEEAVILQFMLKEYILGNDILLVLDVLSQFYDAKEYQHLEHLKLIKSLLELGWIVQSSYNHLKLSEIAQLELLNSSITLSSTFLKLIEGGLIEFVLPEVKQYADNLEYLQDQFFKIDLAQKLNISKHNFDASSPNINRLKSKLTML